jgi:hypothetical protein
MLRAPWRAAAAKISARRFLNDSDVYPMQAFSICCTALFSILWQLRGSVN